MSSASAAAVPHFAVRSAAANAAHFTYAVYPVGPVSHGIPSPAGCPSTALFQLRPCIQPMTVVLSSQHHQTTRRLRLFCGAPHRTAFPKLSSATPSRPAQFQTHSCNALYLADMASTPFALWALSLSQTCHASRGNTAVSLHHASDARSISLFRKATFGLTPPTQSALQPWLNEAFAAKLWPCSGPILPY